MTRCLIFLSVFVTVAIGPLFSCQIPVFRYALEKWDPDPYILIVLHHDDGLEPEEKRAL